MIILFNIKQAEAIKASVCFSLLTSDTATRIVKHVKGSEKIAYSFGFGDYMSF